MRCALRDFACRGARRVRREIRLLCARCAGRLPSSRPADTSPSVPGSFLVGALRTFVGVPATRPPSDASLCLLFTFEDRRAINLETAVAGTPEQRISSIGADFRVIPGTAEQFQIGDRPQFGLLTCNGALASPAGVNRRFKDPWLARVGCAGRGPQSSQRSFLAPQAGRWPPTKVA